MKNIMKLIICLVILVLAIALVGCDIDSQLGVADNNALQGQGTAEAQVDDTARDNGNGNGNSRQTYMELQADIDTQGVILTLPAPDTDGNVSVEYALANRRSHRNFQDRALTIDQLSQILWAAYGVTSPRANTRGGLLTAPSAGALYPLEIYAVVGNVEGLEPGVYRYITDGHKIEKVIAGDMRAQLSEAALGQRMIQEAPVTIFYSAVFSRTTSRYGERGIMYVHMEVGHSAQNIYLQAEALGLGTCAVGAFTDDRVRQLLNLPEDEEPLYLMPVGYVA